MTTVFSRIIAGDLPGPVRLVRRARRRLPLGEPARPGHTLVASRLEVDQWTDAPPALLAHLSTVAHAVGAAVRAVWALPRVGLLVAGFEVPHLHLHVFAASSMAAFDFANAAATIDPAEQDRHAAALRAALRAGGTGVRAELISRPGVPEREAPQPVAHRWATAPRARGAVRRLHSTVQGIPASRADQARTDAYGGRTSIGSGTWSTSTARGRGTSA